MTRMPRACRRLIGNARSRRDGSRVGTPIPSASVTRRGPPGPPVFGVEDDGVEPVGGQFVDQLRPKGACEDAADEHAWERAIALAGEAAFFWAAVGSGQQGWESRSDRRRRSSGWRFSATSAARVLRAVDVGDVEIAVGNRERGVVRSDYVLDGAKRYAAARGDSGTRRHVRVQPGRQTGFLARAARRAAWGGPQRALGSRRSQFEADRIAAISDKAAKIPAIVPYCLTLSCWLALSPLTSFWLGPSLGEFGCDLPPGCRRVVSFSRAR